MPRVLIASDKFKGSLTAVEVADAVGRGLRRGCPDVDVAVVPIADGGDGTVAAALAAGFAAVEVTASGPTGERVRARYARRGDVAVVELAGVSGLSLLPGGRLAPLSASSRGTGEVIGAAVTAGCRKVVVGIGGSASTDGGAGLVQALGARFRDGVGCSVRPGGEGLADLATIDLAWLRGLMSGVQVTVAGDVDNPLTGPLGAAAVYGPQKGADPDQVLLLDRALGHFADRVAAVTGVDHRDVPGAGAAGGVGFALVALLGAELRSGIDLVLDLVDFDTRLDGVDLVVTGEGSLDEQTLHGKAVAGVAGRAAVRAIPVVAVCGQSTLDPVPLQAAGVSGAYPLTDLEPDLEECKRNAAALLQRIGEQIAADHLTSPSTSTKHPERRVSA
jgi:glycerate 2-kinase